MNKNILKAILVLAGITSVGCSSTKMVFNLNEEEKTRVLKNIELYLDAEPITVTSSFCNRSAGSINDFYSEGDYWWPDPQNPAGPYIRKDGLTNTENFNNHREALIRFSQISGALGSVYILTKDQKYVNQLALHLKAWFVDENTKMYPNLLYAQAIKGVATDRGIGIIDTIHLIEVAKAIQAIPYS